MTRFRFVYLALALTACSTASESAPRDASQLRDATLAQGSCSTDDGADACGLQSPDGCWCDDACEDYGDCCEDREAVCESDPSSCAPNAQDAQCGAQSFCAQAEGCEGPGSCTPRPEFCTEQYAPVCGCDGETYANDCFAAAAGVSIDYVGACAGTPCLDDVQCGGGSYCRFDELACDGDGTCQPIPTVCTKEYMPVCGCDGETYGNRCMVAAGGTSIASLGPCPAVAGPDSCIDRCGEQAESGCWCDDTCDFYGDCCGDYQDACVEAEPTTCESLLEAFATETAAVRSCTTDVECGQVLAGTSCGCTRNWVARVDADLTEWEYLQATAQNLQCELPGMVSTCDCPPADGFRCQAGVCGWNYL